MKRLPVPCLVMLLALACLLPSTTAISAPLRFVPQELRQPDGSVLHCFASGDEYYNWLHDKDGYTIVQDHANGYYVYATKSDGRLLPTAHVAGRANPATIGVDAWLKTDAKYLAGNTSFQKPNAGGGPHVTTPTIGKIDNLVIFIRFADEAEYTDSVKI